MRALCRARGGDDGLDVASRRHVRRPKHGGLDDHGDGAVGPGRLSREGERALMRAVRPECAGAPGLLLGIVGGFDGATGVEVAGLHEETWHNHHHRQAEPCQTHGIKLGRRAAMARAGHRL